MVEQYLSSYHLTNNLQSHSRKEMVYVITAAAGRTGRVAAELLLKDGHSVRAIVRSADKGEHLKALGAEIFVGDFTDVPSLVTAFTGATAVYVLNPPNCKSPWNYKMLAIEA